MTPIPGSRPRIAPATAIASLIEGTQFLEARRPLPAARRGQSPAPLVRKTAAVEVYVRAGRRVTRGRQADWRHDERIGSASWGVR
jgi:hypothetical protein